MVSQIQLILAVLADGLGGLDDQILPYMFERALALQSLQVALVVVVKVKDLGLIVVLH